MERTVPRERNILASFSVQSNFTSKFIEIGGRVHFFFVSVSSSSISADICDSFIPPIRFIFHTIAFSLALYFALPFMQMRVTPLVLSGVGILAAIGSQVLLAFRHILKLN